MKRWLCTLIALMLMLAPAATAASDDAPGAITLPQAGDALYGFRVVELRDYPLMDAVIVRFEHEKTGAEVFYIANDDTNRAFDLTFFTDPTDNTGLPHVFEHAVCMGSEKYPSSALWFNLEYQTYNTYFNAQTSNRCTTFPCASLSEAQLLKYADYFTDSCLHPMILSNEQLFRTEAWRYAMEDADAPLTIEGTVYSEMLGALTLQRMAMHNTERAMFPGSMCSNIAGGDPDFIPDLTWEALKSYHERYYHPSNCVAYLYGKLEDYGAFLELLDGYFSRYDRREFSHEDAGYTPIEAPVVMSIPYPVEQGTDTERAAEVYYGFVCPGLKGDAQQALLIKTLTWLLRDGSSNCLQSLKKALPYAGFSISFDEAGPEDVLLFGAHNVNPEDAETFKAAVDAALAEVAENGIPQDQVDGAMHGLKISALLQREGSNPVDTLILNMASAYINTGNCWNYQDSQDSLFRVDEWNAQGLYAKAASDWLIGNQTTVLVTTRPEPGAKERKAAALAEKLERIKAGMSDAEIAAIVEMSHTPAEKVDADEYVAQLKAVDVNSLPEERKLYDVSDVTDERGIRHIDAVSGVKGIGEASVYLDAAGVPQEDIHWLALYCNLLCNMDTGEHTKAELAKRINRYLYGFDAYTAQVPEGGDGYHNYMRMIWTALDEDLEESYDVVREIIFDTRFDDVGKLSENVQSFKSGLKRKITADPESLLLRRALAATDEGCRYATYSSELDFYDFLTRTEDMLRTDPDAVVSKLEGIQRFLKNRRNAVTLFAGNADSIALNREISDRFLDSLEDRTIEPVEYDLPVPAKNEALIIDSAVQYNMLVADGNTLGLTDYTGDLDAVTNVVNDTFLVPLLRDQYGVYTPMHEIERRPCAIYIYAYRDPNIAETYAVLDKLPGLVADMEMDQETLDGYIMKAYAVFAMPTGELDGAYTAAKNTLYGLSQDQPIEWMRQLKALTPEKLKDYDDMYAKLSEHGARKTAGSASAINANAEQFDAILNPFGAAEKASSDD